MHADASHRAAVDHSHWNTAGEEPAHEQVRPCIPNALLEIDPRALGIEHDSILSNPGPQAPSSHRQPLTQSRNDHVVTVVDEQQRGERESDKGEPHAPNRPGGSSSSAKAAPGRTRFTVEG